MDTKWFTKLYITITREIVTNHLQFCGIWKSFLGSCLVMLHLKDLFAAWNTQNKRISVLVLYVTPSSNMYWQKIRKNQQFVINRKVNLGLKIKSHFWLKKKWKSNHDVFTHFFFVIKLFLQNKGSNLSKSS